MRNFVWAPIYSQKKSYLVKRPGKLNNFIGSVINVINVTFPPFSASQVVIFSAFSISLYLYYSVQGYPYWMIKQQVRLQSGFYIVHPRVHRKNIAIKSSGCWYELVLTLKSEKKLGKLGKPQPFCHFHIRKRKSWHGKWHLQDNICAKHAAKTRKY